MKKKFVLRLDDHLYESIEKWAADEFRSANGQIEWVLHKAIKDAGRESKKKMPKEEDQK